jgi:hypothetical protein
MVVSRIHVEDRKLTFIPENIPECVTEPNIPHVVSILWESKCTLLVI